VPFRKLRTLDEGEATLWMDRRDPRLPQRIRELWAFSFRLAPRRFPPGVFRFRSIEEKNLFDEARRQVNVRAQRNRLTARSKGPRHG
jgi:hypothetical protein